MDRIRERQRLAMEVTPSRAVKPGTRSREQALQMEFAEYMLEDPVDDTDLLAYWKGNPQLPSTRTGTRWCDQGGHTWPCLLGFMLE